MVVKTYTFIGKSANCDLTTNWALLKSVAGQRLYTIQRLRSFSAKRHVALCERHVGLHERHVALLECHVTLHVRHVALLIFRQ